MCSSLGLVVARDLTLALKANRTRHHYRVLIGTPWYNLISFPSNYRGQWSLTHFIEDQLRLRKVKELGQVTQVLNPDHLIKN